MGDCNEILNSSSITGRSLEVCRTKNFRRYESIAYITLDSVDVGSLLWFAHLWSFLINKIIHLIIINLKTTTKQMRKKNPE